MTQDYPEPVSRLLTLGEIDWKNDWADYPALGLGPEHIPALIRLALDEDLNFDGDWSAPEPWATIHAWRALGQLRAEEAITPLATLLSRRDDGLDDAIDDELPQVFACIGPAALPALRAYFTDETHAMRSRSTCINALVEIVRRFPEYRDEVVEILTGQLAHFAEQDRTLNALIICPLAIELHAVEAAPLIEQTYAAGQVDLTMLGDWEDAQIHLRLLEKRLTPAPNYLLTEHPEMAEVLQALDAFKQRIREIPPSVDSLDQQARLDQQRREQARHQREQEKKARAKRKAEKKARRKNR